MGENISAEERMSGYLFDTMEKMRKQEQEKTGLLERVKLLEQRVKELEAGAVQTKRGRRQ